MRARALLWMAATGLLFTVLNAILKKVSHELDPWLVGWLRHAAGAVNLPSTLWLAQREARNR